MRRLWYLLPLPLLALAFVLWRREPPPQPDAPAPARGNRDIRVEVLNGCGIGGIARVVGNRLRGAGFDVLTLDNADSFSYPESIVVDRVGKPEHAEAVARALGIPNRIQQIIPDPFRIESVTVIIGRDYLRLGLDAPAPTGSPPERTL